MVPCLVIFPRIGLFLYVISKYSFLDRGTYQFELFRTSHSNNFRKKNSFQHDFSISHGHLWPEHTRLTRLCAVECINIDIAIEICLRAAFQVEDQSVPK